MARGDVDNDGDLDLVEGNYSNKTIIDVDTDNDGLFNSEESDDDADEMTVTAQVGCVAAARYGCISSCRIRSWTLSTCQCPSVPMLPHTRPTP